MTQTTSRNVSELPLEPFHRDELLIESAIDPEVVRERGYTTVSRPTVNDDRPREQLRRQGFPSWAIRENAYFPGLWIPQYSPAGRQYAGQFKPRRPVPGRDGKPQRYASAKGPARLDVHPRWSRDRGGMQLPAIQDPSERLWFTEGTKKADALTSRGCVTVALAGVYSWRNTHATLGDWEDVRIKGRECVICFDADAVTKPAVAQAMARLGKWLRHKGAAKVWYLTVPAMVNDSACKGVDDYFAAGGTLKALEQAFATAPPQVTDTEDRFTDARLAETLASEVLEDTYAWAPGLDWMRWDGRRWSEATEVTVIETVRQWAAQHHVEAVTRLRADDKSAGAEVDGWRKMLGEARIKAVTRLGRGIVEERGDVFDTHGHMVLANGVLDPGTRLLTGHYPELRNRNVLPFRYEPEATCPGWHAFLAASLPGDVEAWHFLAEWFGYVLSGRMDQQKMASLVGKRRSGKGTIARILAAMLGMDAVAGTDLGSLGSHFGRMDLIGKSLATMDDVRWNVRGAGEAVPFLLRIIGNDNLTVPRKHMSDWTGRLGVRFMMTGNDTPVFSDRSNAMAARMIHVVFPVSFEGREDFDLEPRLMAELPGILNWALDGLERLTKQGRFTVPASGQEEDEAVRRGSNPIGAFVDDWCVLEPDASVELDELFRAWEVWCGREGIREPGRKEIFTRVVRSQNGLPAAHRVGQAKVRYQGGIRLVKVDRVDRLGGPPQIG